MRNQPLAVTLRPGVPDDHAALFELWLAAVRATHDFLVEEDLEHYSRLMREDYLPAPGLVVAVGPDGRPVGFMGLTDEYGERSIDALFVDPAFHRRGVGRALAEYALRGLSRGELVRVDVNEQNDGARRFYKTLGFTMAGRSEGDYCGRPYPLLHLVLRA